MMLYRRYVRFLLELLVIQIYVRACVTLDITREAIINYIFNETRYRHTERPLESNTTYVMVFMKVIAINSVNVSQMEYSTDLYLRQQWTDIRLNWQNIPELNIFTSHITSPSLKERLWLPDLFFRNGKEGYVHRMTQPNYLIRLKPNGEILYSQKITMRFSCQMDLQTYPMDKQVCDMNIGSYGYTLDQLKFWWRLNEPVIIGKDVQIPEFNEPGDVSTIDCDREVSTTTGKYTCLKANFSLQRQLGSYLVSTFIPNTLIVIVSWLNFWVSVDAVPARITLGLLTLLGILTQANGISRNLPRVSYIKAIDVWLIACIVFVIGALLEFVIASTVAQHKRLTTWKIEVREIVRYELTRWNLALQRQKVHHMQTSKILNRRELEFCEELDQLLSAQQTNNGYHQVDYHNHNHYHHLTSRYRSHTNHDHANNHHHNSANTNNHKQTSSNTTKSSSKTTNNDADNISMSLLYSNNNSETTYSYPSKYQFIRKRKRKFQPDDDVESIIDHYSRYLFPSCFFLYNFCYWIYYLLIV